MTGHKADRIRKILHDGRGKLRTPRGRAILANRIGDELGMPYFLVREWIDQFDGIDPYVEIEFQFVIDLIFYL
jgi:hypothetical protein